MAVSFWEHKARIAFKPAYNTRPANYHGDLFVPSFNFPAEEPKEDFKKLPWMKIDFKTSPMDYLDTVLHYCFDGNTECDFRVENNGTHPDRWYHAPWMAYPPSGREPIHGLTMERPTEPQYFGLKDQKWLQTWALSFYNDFGAKTISDFWEKPWEPALKDDVTFPPGTVSFKLLFTEATEDDVPSLAVLGLLTLWVPSDQYWGSLHSGYHPTSTGAPDTLGTIKPVLRLLTLWVPSDRYWGS
ncbi:uncharacterized protein LOC118416408 [Branchiostoma floridae]|uniref:Uncharacterized protein LOC118416408 n=1 Tax=Branchiostoma floridae TaxID=7739 RepID=A0A9J7L754_BRAFL|nr:uncharacterized protein LOC118416408 [Branchiostoma floridae]